MATKQMWISRTGGVLRILKGIKQVAGFKSTDEGFDRWGIDNLIWELVPGIYYTDKEVVFGLRAMSPFLQLISVEATSAGVNEMFCRLQTNSVLENFKSH